MNISKRFQEIDLFRGIAVIGMIIYHALFSLNFFNVINTNISSDSWLPYLRFVQLTFLGLVGISMAISKKTYTGQIKRALKIFAGALAITLVTYIFVPDYFIIFGILHLITVSVLILPIAKNKKHMGLIFGLAAVAIWLFIKDISSENIFLFILGFKNTTISSLDYFSIFPWMAIPFFGLEIGHYLYKDNAPIIDTKFPKFLCPILFLGRHSLVIYLIHVPIILALMFICQTFLRVLQ
ncbi:MAG: heparan-alpha-glucosaminide N-acetyltransferase [Candidatus Peregrinibacteria bacterium]|nr:heparan-alpha-glucosaminide N-acetyltransferase [Candidatus Peregrinibacteria bacterium]